MEDSNIIAKSDNENKPLALTGVGTDEVVGILPLLTFPKKRKREEKKISLTTIAEEKKKNPKIGASLGYSPSTITKKSKSKSSTPAKKKKKKKKKPKFDALTANPSKYPPGSHTVDTPGNPWKSVYTYMETPGNCCIGNPWKPMATNANWKPMETNGNHIYGNIWKPMTTYGHFHGNPWQLLHRKPVETHGHQTHGFP